MASWRLHKVYGWAVNARDVAAQQLYVAPGRLIAKDACIRCYDNQVWIRSPFVNQLKYSSDPALARQAVPDDAKPKSLTHVGAAFASWNTPAAGTVRMEIDPNIDVGQPRGSAPAAPANTCTTCHYIGKTRLVAPSDAEGTCNPLAKDWLHPETRGPVTGGVSLRDGQGAYSRIDLAPLAAARRGCQRAGAGRRTRR
jgi:hypothetical protein